MAEHEHVPVPFTDPEYCGVGAIITVCDTCGVILEKATS